MVDRRFGIGVGLTGPGLVSVEAADPRFESVAQRWALRFSVPCVSPPGSEGVRLTVDGSGFSLGFANAKRGHPLRVDFLEPPWRGRWSRPNVGADLFRRALGLRGRPGLVVDATAGLGQDAVWAAGLGNRVVAVERSPVLALMLREALTRALAQHSVAHESLARLTFLESDARVWLRSGMVEGRPDVVYLDPMFEKPKKSAKSPKDMQLLQELLGPPVAADDRDLFAAALAAAPRVVVKRPLKAAPLAASPRHSWRGQSIRYDVYLS